MSWTAEKGGFQPRADFFQTPALEAKPTTEPPIDPPRPDGGASSDKHALTPQLLRLCPDAHTSMILSQSDVRCCRECRTLKSSRKKCGANSYECCAAICQGQAGAVFWTAEL